MNNSKIMPTTCLLMAILVMIISHFMVPLAWIIPPMWSLAGLVLIATGVMINLMADKAFHQAHTTVKPFEESSSLVTNGVFRISRNPMYLGFVMILIGIAVLLRTLSPYLVALVFAILMDMRYIRTEEYMLKEKFGLSWEQYRSGTRRWL